MNNAEQCTARGRRVLSDEAAALVAAAERLDEGFAAGCRLILEAGPGRLAVTGLGKSGHVAAKLAATFSSTGTPSYFIHPSEAAHGDFGMLGRNDVVMVIAYSGRTPEVVEVARFAQERGQPVIAITGDPTSPLAQLADVHLDGRVRAEADCHDLAPTCSSTVALALGDAMAVAVMEQRGFGQDEFGRLHPGGSLGRCLAPVRRWMHPLTVADMAEPNDNFHCVLRKMNEKNYGIVPVVTPGPKLVGCITDGDLRRQLIGLEAKALTLSAAQLMHVRPLTTEPRTACREAVAQMQAARITTLFVVNADECLVGLVKLSDIL